MRDVRPDGFLVTHLLPINNPKSVVGLSGYWQAAASSGIMPLDHSETHKL